MKLTVISKNYGNQTINTDTYIPEYAACDTPLFKIIEHIFSEWYNHNTQPGAPMGKDIQGMYFGEGDQPAIYSVKGAIRQGIQNLIDLAVESGKQIFNTADIVKLDIESAFE